MADGVHIVLVELTTVCISEVTHGVWRVALGHFASVVLSRCHIVEGVVGGLPFEDDHIGGAIVNSVRVSWSAGHWGNQTGNQTLKHNYWGGNESIGRHVMCLQSGSMRREEEHREEWSLY